MKSNHIIFPSFFLPLSFSFFLTMTSVYLLIGDVEDIIAPNHTDTPHSVGFLWTRDRSFAETST
jgi:hypothetical protein